MKKILVRNIKGLVQAGESIPSICIGKEMRSVPVIENAFIATEEGEVVAYGQMEELGAIDDWTNLEVIDAEDRYVLPAFCDSHTHAVFARAREEEFVDRIHGLTYAEIAEKGGGILNSARRLNELSEEELFVAALERIHKFTALGTGAIEIKSGYGLSVEAELKMLRVIKRLKAESPITVKSTFLGAHAFPAEFIQNQEEYIKLITEEMLPKISDEGLADFIDCFCERNYFSVDQMERILSVGNDHGLIPKVHVNQFSVLGGVRKAVELGALSVDHLEELTEDDLDALKGTHCIPTLLPGCSHFLGIPFGDARRIMDFGLPLALASDFNPGSAPSGNLQQVWSLACIKMKMTPEEALNALTVNAAFAMGLSETHGRISLGRRSPILITKPIPSLAYIPYSFGESHVERVLY